MKRLHLWMVTIILMTLILLTTSPIRAEERTFRNVDTIFYFHQENYDTIYREKCNGYYIWKWKPQEAGELDEAAYTPARKPQLPWYRFDFDIPEGSKIYGYELTTDSVELLYEGERIIPWLARPQSGWDDPVKDSLYYATLRTWVYEEDIYPEQQGWLDRVYTPYKGTGTVASFLLTPFLYDTQKENVYFYCKIHLHITIVHDMSGIAALASSTRISSLFDLSGRRLSAPPSKGIYIENGCKRVAK